MDINISSVGGFPLLSSMVMQLYNKINGLQYLQECFFLRESYQVSCPDIAPPPPGRLVPRDMVGFLVCKARAGVYNVI